MSNCEQIYDYLDELAQGKSDAVPKDILEHAMNCEACHRRVKAWTRLVGKMKFSEFISVPEGLEERVLNALKEERQKDTLEEKIIRVNWWKPVAMAAGISLFALGSYFYISNKNVSDLKQMAKESMVSKEMDSARELKITLYLPEAQSVALVGDFNGWNKSNLLLKKDENGFWAIRIPLEQGYYQYQLLVNGDNWVLDPNNKTQVEDGFGGVNSAVLI